MFAPTTSYIDYLLKLHCHSVSLGKLNKFNVQIVPPSLYSKVRVIFVIRLYILPYEEFVFAPTAPYIIHLFQVHFCPAFLGKLYK